MTPVTPVQTIRSMALSPDVDATSGTDAATEPAAPASTAETAASNSLASVSPPGGLHPIAGKPGTALFGFIVKAVHSALGKDPPASGIGGGSGSTSSAGLNVLRDFDRDIRNAQHNENADPLSEGGRF